jgi:hypothetical protein
MVAPLFLFSEMRLWQRIGYLFGAGLWLLSSFALPDATLKIIASVVLIVSSAEVVMEHLPFRA